MRNPLGTQAEIANLDRAAMTFYLAGASLMLALVELAHVKPVEFADPTRDLLYCLAYGFAPAAAGYAMAIINRLAGRGRTSLDFMDDRNSYLIDYRLTPIEQTAGPYLSLIHI